MTACGENNDLPQQLVTQGAFPDLPLKFLWEYRYRKQYWKSCREHKHEPNWTFTCDVDSEPPLDIEHPATVDPTAPAPAPNSPSQPPRQLRPGTILILMVWFVLARGRVVRGPWGWPVVATALFHL